MNFLIFCICSIHFAAKNILLQLIKHFLAPKPGYTFLFFFLFFKVKICSKSLWLQVLIKTIHLDNQVLS